MPADVYASLRFPDHLIADGEAWGITASDDAYAKVLEDPGWRALHDHLCGEQFVMEVLRAFAVDMQRERCLVDARRARLVPFSESRAEKAMRTLSDPADPNEIFTRLDFQSKKAGGYRDFVHLDWARRITGGILFFSDAAEEDLEGGELAFYRDRDFRNDRWCHDPELVTQYAPRANSGVIFLNTNGAFHGPRPIVRLRGRRRWLYYAISSRIDVWPHD
ncbi:MAG TPA: 2OG-Fe(II) oxygenase [Thermoanaerobaculia bacterium]|nr:2OG-Fe(II) oxygenase [Thermoanaerobaculia bacterium]